MVFSTDMPNIDDMLFGGFPEGRVSGIFAVPNTGKSLLANQVAMKAISEGKKCLFLMSPSEYDSRKISEIFLERYGLTEKDLPDYKKILNMTNLGSLFGLDIIVDKTGNKTSVQIREKKAKRKKKGEEPVKEWRMKDFEPYDLIIIDSFSELIKLSIVMEVQNLGARSSMETQIFGAMTECMEKYNTTFILVHHASVNPMAIADAQSPFGGPVLLYLSKYLVLMKKANKPLYDKFGKLGRRIQRYRWTGSIESEFEPMVIKKDYGLIDAEDEEE